MQIAPIDFLKFPIYWALIAGTGGGLFGLFSGANLWPLTAILCAVCAFLIAGLAIVSIWLFKRLGFL